MKYQTQSIAVLLGLAAVMPARAHDGRRFEIEVVDGQLAARGVNTITNIGPDGATVIDPAGPRPYYNAIHGHWGTLSSTGGTVVFTDLPGFDAGRGTEDLETYDVLLTLTGVQKWTNVSDDFAGATPMITPGTVPNFEPLAADEVITFGIGGQSIDTETLGTVTLIAGFDGLVTFGPDGLANATTSNGYDRDVEYVYSLGEADIADTIYVLEQELTTDAPGVLGSETVYTILSPNGRGPFERLHFAALYTEAFLGTPVPEPAGAALTLLLGGILAR
ncbi:MAG: hypothetical protein AAGL98_06060, partial [Planctomycetota bacterium]